MQLGLCNAIKSGVGNQQDIRLLDSKKQRREESTSKKLITVINTSASLLSEQTVDLQPRGDSAFLHLELGGDQS